jgi:hypothetical protein
MGLNQSNILREKRTTIALKIKTILIGYPGSQFLVPGAKYLLDKYPELDVVFLNHTGTTQQWSSFVADYLATIDEEKIILALDDYLVESIDTKRLVEAMELQTPVKLCDCSEEEHIEYPVTTQYTIWDRLELIELLKQTTSPWDFEINGSKIMGRLTHLYPCMKYDVHSALSSRWDGVRMKLLEEDKIRELCNI